jgi:hypothetical protein
MVRATASISAPVEVQRDGLARALGTYTPAGRVASAMQAAA